MKRLRSLQISLLSLWLFAGGVVCADELTLITGEKSGVYYRLGCEIRAVLETNLPNISIKVRPSSGSWENIKALDAGEAQLALVQNNVAGEFLDRNQGSAVKGLLSLYPEPVQLLVHKDAGIYSVRDLKGKRVVVGRVGNVNYLVIRSILREMGIHPWDIQAQYCSLDKLPQRMIERKVDAAFVIAGTPVPLMINAGDCVELVDFPDDVIDRLTRSRKYFVPVTIPPNAYPWINSEINTVGVQSLLVCRSDLDADVTHAVARVLAHSQKFKELLMSYGADYSLQNLSSAGMSVPLHTGADAAYREDAAWWLYMAFKFCPWLFVAAIIAVGLLIIFGSHPVLCHIRKKPSLQAALFLLSTYFLATIGLHLSERYINPSFSSLSGSLWSTTLYLLSGLEGHEPLTSGGRIFSAIMLLSALGLMGFVVGSTAALFLRRSNRNMLANKKGHIAICNWNNRTEKIIRELHSSEACPNCNIQVFFKNKEAVNEEDLRKDPLFNKVYFLQADSQLHDVIERNEVYLARSVIVLADESAADPDAESVLTVLAVRSLCDAKGIDAPHIVAEAISPARKEHLLAAGVDEVVCSNDYGLGVLAQCAINRDLSHVYENLLHYTEETNEIYIVELQDQVDAIAGQIAGITFDTAQNLFAKARENESGTKQPSRPILLGVRKSVGKTFEVRLNPPNDLLIEKEDALIFMAFNRPNLKTLLG